MATRRKLKRQTLEVVPAKGGQGAATPRADLLEFRRGQRGQGQRLAGVVAGTLKGFGKAGDALVDFGAGAPRVDVPARSTVALRPNDIGRQVALLFEEGDRRRPIVVGVIHPSPAEEPAPAEGAPEVQPREVEIDGARLAFTAQQEIVLRCGKATITLTRAGKILIRGAYLLTRSSGMNRIKGGSVQIN